MANSLFPTSASIKKLRAYHQDKLFEIDVGRLRRELLPESDRAKVILLCSILEDALDYRIEQSIPIAVTSGQLKYIFRYEGPLGVFSHKIEVAYLFSLINKNVATQLNIIREMRNACAHSKFELHFGMDELADVATQLFSPLGFVSLWENTAIAINHAFLIEMPVLLLTLIYGSREKAIDWLRVALPDLLS